MQREAAVERYKKGQDALERRTIKQALEHFERAEHLGFDANQCAASRWDCWMLLGDFERAWAESDRIASSGAPDPHRFWDGRTWSGKRVMLRCLHGLGDTIQLIRYAPLLRQTCRELIVQAHPQLTRLLEGVDGVDRVVSWGPGYIEREADWDMQMEINELPRAFRTTLQSIPARVPYIHVPEQCVAEASKLFPSRRGLRIGVCWQSGPWDPCRSIGLQQLEPVLNNPAHQFFNLQKGADSEPPLLDLEKHNADVRDTAAAILNLDLVITVDTMTAHLAGALGRPVWILLPLCADWRWMLGRRDTPWYPTARLFRQTQQSDWTSVIAEVAAALGSYES